LKAWHLVKISLLLVGVLVVAVFEAMDGKFILALAIGGAALFVGSQLLLLRMMRAWQRMQEDRAGEDDL
jgi:hypothetical protein